MAAVRIYTTRVCGYCLAAKALLKTKGVAYDEIDVSDDDAARRWLVETTGQRTVPQIFIADRSIGGFHELYALDRAGDLEALLAGEAL